MGVYSFLDNYCTITGPGINTTITTESAAQVGSGAGTAKEGMSVTFEENKTTVVTGSDGSIMGSLHASQTGRITIRLLKVSPLNAVLSQAYAAQRLSSQNWQQNQIIITNNVLGDLVNGQQMAFEKFPDNDYAEDGNMLAWIFIGLVVENLGPGAVAA